MLDLFDKHWVCMHVCMYTLCACADNRSELSAVVQWFLWCDVHGMCVCSPFPQVNTDVVVGADNGVQSFIEDRWVYGPAMTCTTSARQYSFKFFNAMNASSFSSDSPLLIVNLVLIKSRASSTVAHIVRMAAPFWILFAHCQQVQTQMTSSWRAAGSLCMVLVELYSTSSSLLELENTLIDLSLQLRFAWKPVQISVQVSVTIEWLTQLGMASWNVQATCYLQHSCFVAFSWHRLFQLHRDSTGRHSTSQHRHWRWVCGSTCSAMGTAQLLY